MYTRANTVGVLAGLVAALSAVPVSAQTAVAVAQPKPASREIAMGETKTGTLTSEDPQLDEGEHYHSYTFEGRAGDRVLVSLRSSAFDSYLAMLKTDVDFEEQDDDSGGNSNAELNVTLPETGRYVIVVTSYEGEETGSYTLSVKASDGTSERSDDGWALYGRTSDSDAELFYLPSSIRRYGDGVFEVWTRWVYSGMQPASPGGDPYDNEKRLMRVDCQAERLGMVSFVEYSGEATVNQHTIKNVELNPSVPGSVGESLVRQVCSDRIP
jgi:hypothetical protein